MIMKAANNIFFKISLITAILNGSILAVLSQVEPQVVAQPAKKQVPIITYKNLSPPYEDYDYFQGVQEYPFQAAAASFNLINAWWLAEVSTLVYSDPEFVRTQFNKIGLPEVRFFDKQGTQCYVANNDHFAVVAFRGSEIWKKEEKFDLNRMIADLKTDVDIRLTAWPPGGKVHRGFKEALEEVWPELSDRKSVV